MKSLTVVVPLFNEEENIYFLCEELLNNLKEYKNLEILLKNDGSKDYTKNKIENFIKHKKTSCISLINLERNKGQSNAIYEGVLNSKFEIIATIDGDLQNDPKDIIKLLKIYNDNDDIALVGGIRVNRKDNIIKILSSKLANFIRSKYLGDGCKDTGCALKVFSKSKFLELPYFNGMHRFYPALFRAFNGKVIYTNVNHRKRIYGKSKYGISNRFFNNIKNMVMVKKIIKSKK